MHFAAGYFKGQAAMRLLVSALVALILSICFGPASAADATGSWAYQGPAESGLWLDTLQVGNKVRFQLELSRGAPSYNSGSLEGEFELNGASGVFETREYGTCRIKFEFKAASVKIMEAEEEEQKCGFGYNVHANGTLVLKSRKKPTFSAGDSRNGPR
jgi:hypothetical protein